MSRALSMWYTLVKNPKVCSLARYIKGSNGDMWQCRCSVQAAGQS